MFDMQDSATPLKTAEDTSRGLMALFSEVSSLAIRLKGAPGSGEKADALPGGGMTVLRVLDEHGPQTVPQIARLRGTSRQNIQILVNRLEARGCVELSRNPAHKRSGLVQLTGPGKALFSQAAGQEARFLADLLSRVPEAEVVSAASLLRQLRQMLVKAERPSDAVVERQPPEIRPGDGVPRVARRKTLAPPGRQKPARAAVIPPEPESNEGDLPYNLL